MKNLLKHLVLNEVADNAKIENDETGTSIKYDNNQFYLEITIRIQEKKVILTFYKKLAELVIITRENWELPNKEEVIKGAFTPQQIWNYIENTKALGE